MRGIGASLSLLHDVRELVADHLATVSVDVRSTARPAGRSRRFRAPARPGAWSRGPRRPRGRPTESRPGRADPPRLPAPNS